MEEVTEGSNPVTKNAKAAESMDTKSKGGASKVIHVDSDSMEGAKGTKNAGKSAAAPVGKAPVPSTKPSDASAKWRKLRDDETIAEEETSETKYDFTQDVDALVSGEELSEEFRVKAATIFEAAVTLALTKKQSVARSI